MKQISAKAYTHHATKVASKLRKGLARGRISKAATRMVAVLQKQG